MTRIECATFSHYLSIVVFGGVAMAFDPVDVHVGARLRQRRQMLSISQEKVAEELGLTFQQIQKYERGANRISASRLHQLSELLDVPLSFFFDGLPMSRTVEPRAPGSSDQETAELARNFEAIDDADVRRRVLRMVEALAQMSEHGRRDSSAYDAA
jgi:transcriptional regulator with XRE-family HTH domain